MRKLLILLTIIISVKVIRDSPPHAARTEIKYYPTPVKKISWGRIKLIYGLPRNS